jgi:hypothetical protein
MLDRLAEIKGKAQAGQDVAIDVDVSWDKAASNLV